MAEENTNEEIIDRSQSPQKVIGDEGTVEERPIKDMIDADRYAKANNSGTTKVPFGLRIARTKPPGTP